MPDHHQRKRALRLGLLVVAAFLFYWIWLRDPITWQNYRKIENGMTEWQVRWLLGLEERKDPASQFALPDRILNGATHVAYWHGKKMQIQVFYDSEGRVRGKISNDYLSDY